MTLRLSRLHFPVTALGPGRRLGIWTQGCTIGCPGCISRDTWPSTVDGQPAVPVPDVLAWCVRHAGVDGVTISGGEPSEQPAALTELVAGLDRHRRERGWDLLCYTGVEEDEFARRCPEVHGLVDALITGPRRCRDAGLVALLRSDWCRATLLPSPKRPRDDGTPPPTRGDGVLLRFAQADGVSSTSRLRVRFGSTGMPGPVVVETVTFFR